MKCPKCDYLGFDTGDRCKNCGYDFSLMPLMSEPELRVDVPVEPTPTTKYWLDQLDAALGTPTVEPVVAPAPEPRREPRMAIAPEPVRESVREPVRVEARLPLFRPPADEDDDEPLIKLPVAPRAPLSVRKTPEIPRLRAVPRPSPRVEEPVLQFVEESAPDLELRLREDEAAPAMRAPRVPLASRIGGIGTAGPRLGAAAIDHGILLAIDVAVVYFTLRMAALPLDQWQVLPAAPLLAFLILVKFAYFYAFTAMGGQTIGKMALGIRVVGDGDTAIDPGCALRRTVAGLASLVFGLGLLPALFDSQRRTFHDRVAHTRVVALRPV